MESRSISINRSSIWSFAVSCHPAKQDAESFILFLLFVWTAYRKRTRPGLPPAPAKNSKNEWICAARIVSGSDVTLEIFSPDGSLLSLRSYLLSVEHDGKTYSVSLKEKEVRRSGCQECCGCQSGLRS